MQVQPLHLIRLPQVKARTGLSGTEIYRRIKRGSFPRQIPLGPQTSAWSSADIDAWIAERIKASRATAGGAE